MNQNENLEPDHEGADQDEAHKHTDFDGDVGTSDEDDEEYIIVKRKKRIQNNDEQGTSGGGDEHREDEQGIIGGGDQHSKDEQGTSGGEDQHRKAKGENNDSSSSNESSSDTSTESMQTPNSSDDEDIKKLRKPKGKGFRGKESEEFCLNMRFESAGQFRQAVQDYALKNEKAIKFTRSVKLKKVYKHGLFPIMVEGYNRFKRIFVGFDALKEGFLGGCRPVISLDGCFLKSKAGGQLLSAVGRDGNNQMFLVCWAVVEGENEESWRWFLIRLTEHLGIVDGFGWTIISDQQKGLQNTVRALMPNA
ncbi:hypothetical protein Cni_G19740 [Canna indica]|uniref:MULE transposase domain-containing protein n=1 Tax=Canna indica TaxID=4628 RepID=A0AAQ3QH71_9LILI|nr:hypothetical protein Cni_G19740 [Canna indica]